MINVTPPTNFVSLQQPLPSPSSDQPFDLLLGTVSAPVPDIALTPAASKPADTLTAEAIESGATLLAFLGFNPVKAPQGEPIAKGITPLAEDEDDVVATDLTVPTPSPTAPQYQPFAATIAVSNPVAVQSGLRPAPDAPTGDDRSAGATIARSAVAASSSIDQIANAAIKSVEQNSDANISPASFETAARAAAAESARPFVVTNDPPPVPTPASRDATRPDPAEIAVAASVASLVQGRSPQTPIASADAPEERVADIELLGTSPTTSASPLPTSSLTNGPTTPIAITQADPVQTIADRQLDLARDTRWIDELARDIVNASGRSDRLSFSLVPPQLGQLQVDLSHSDLGLSVHMRSDSEATTQIVGAAQPRLVEELKSQGIRVASTEVTTGGGQSQGQSQQQRDDSQLFEFARQRFETTDDTETDRPGGRFA
jgi:flagellar hook-length control protein FliK